MMRLRPSSARLVPVLASLWLTACGGGGGGNASPPANAASLTVSPTQIEFTASGDTSWVPTQQLTVTVHNGAASGTYIGATYTKNAITGIAFTVSGATGLLTATFKDPSTIAPGVYSDSIQVGICVDSNCKSTQSGSVVTVSVKYTVTIDATVSFSASPTTVGAGSPTTLTWSSTHAQSCTASGEWSGTLPSAGSQSVTPTSVGPHTYSISCSNPGVVAQAGLTVTAAGVSLALSAFPANVALGKPVTLRWIGQYAQACTASGDWSGTLAASGTKTFTPTAQGTTTYHLVCTNTGGSDQKDATVTVIPGTTLPPATAYRVNEAHTGVLVTPSGAATPSQTTPLWTHDLGAPVSYPLVAGGRVYVATAMPNGSYGNMLYALDAKTGATVWGPIAISGTYFGSGQTYDNGVVFHLMFDGGVHAFDAATGAALWTTQLPGYWYEASPNAYGGIVFISGNAGTTAIDEASGKILWTANGGTTDWSSPAIASDGVYMQEGYSCTASAFDPIFGTTLWQTTSSCNSPWGYAGIVKGGTFYGRVGGSIDLFDAASGTFKTQVGTSLAPAITDTSIIAVNSGTLSATRISDLVQLWTFSGDSAFTTAPVVVNGTAYVGAASGNVYGVDLTTGKQVWVGAAPAGINSDSENGGPMPPSGPTAGENVLLFVSGTSLVAWPLP